MSLPTCTGNDAILSQFEITPEVVTVTMFDGLLRDRAVGVQIVSSPVRSLQWQSGLDYVLAATDTTVNWHVISCNQLSDPYFYLVSFKVMRFPIEDCSSNMNCSSCVNNTNPLCGWCVVENKCSRQSLCQNGKSISSTRWIPSNRSADVSELVCIVNTISPDQFLLDNQQVVSSNSTYIVNPGLLMKLKCVFS